jgi:hypothetical protein
VDIDLDSEGPGAGETPGAQGRANAFEHLFSFQLPAGEKPHEQVAAEIGGEPNGDEFRKRPPLPPADTGQHRANDRIRGALPADEVETVEGAQHADGRGGAHCRNQ